jgi:CubicO group peptidase (beta-lactamase class C family)
MKLRICASLLALAFVSIAVESAFAQLDNAASIDSYLASYLAKCGAPGLSCVVVKDGKSVYLKGLGVEVAGLSAPMTADSSSAIGSLTKSFTCLSVMQLVEAGKLDLDKRVVDYLPWFRLADKDKSDKITLRLLMNNRSGIPSVDAWMEDASTGDEAIERGVRALSSAQMTREPGSSFEYANENFDILGLIVSRVSGLPYGEYVSRNILEPLGMTRSSTDLAKLESLGALTGHRLDVDTFTPSARNFTAMAEPAGSALSCSARDMGAYLAMMLGWGEYKGTRILSRAGIESLEKPSINVPGTSVEMGGTGEDIYYAMGWMRASIEGYELVFHAGNNGLMSSMTMFDPARGLGVCILFNYSSDLDPYRFDTSMRLCYNVLRLADGKPLSSYGVPRRKDPNLAERFVSLGEGNLGRFVGDYEGGKDRSVDASLEGKGGDSRLVVRTRLTPNALQYRGYRLEFISPSRGVGICKYETAPFSVRYDDSGDVLSFTLRGITLYPRRTKLPSGYVIVSLPGSPWTLALGPGMKASYSSGVLAASDGKRTIRLSREIGDAGRPEDFLPAGAKVLVEGELLSESRSGRLYRERAFELRDGRAIFMAVAESGGGCLVVSLETSLRDLTQATQEVLVPALESLNP